VFTVRTTALQVSTNCQIFPIESELYGKDNIVENLLMKFDSFVQSDVLLKVNF
jgi:hypothetical protein